MIDTEGDEKSSWWENDSQKKIKKYPSKVYSAMFILKVNLDNQDQEIMRSQF